MNKLVLIKAKPLSSNEAWKGRRFKTDMYKIFERALLLMLPASYKVPEEGKLEIFLEFGFSNCGCDWDNPIKPFVDILQKKYGFNDNRIYKGTVLKTIVKKGEEFIKVDLKLMDEEEKIEELQQAMREIYEVWAGSEGVIPVTTSEVYQETLIKEMRDIVKKYI